MRNIGGSTYPLLKVGNFFISQSVRLRNDRNQVDLGVKAAHNLDVKRFQGMSSWLDEEDTSVYAVIDNVHTVDLVLSFEVSIKTLLNVFNDGPP